MKTEKSVLPKKMFICVAPEPRQQFNLAMEQEGQYPPYTPEGIAEEVIASYKEGASMVHLHARDERGNPTKNPERYVKICKLIKEKCPDIVFNISAVVKDDPRVDALVQLGLIDTGVLNMMLDRFPNPDLTAKYLQDKGVKTQAGVYNFYQLEEYKRIVINPGIIEKPYLIDLCIGIHPPAMPPVLDSLNLLVKHLPPDNVCMMIPGGRNWIPLVAEATILGLEGVRVGVEDTLYWRPHIDDTIKNCKDVVAFTRHLIEDLGREVATPSDLRKMLGI